MFDAARAGPAERFGRGGPGTGCLLEVEQGPVGVGDLVEERKLTEFGRPIRPNDRDGSIGRAEVDADEGLWQKTLERLLPEWRGRG